MTTNKAIRILKDMRKDIDGLPPAETLPTNQHREWLWRIKSYADNFFEKGSSEHELISCTSFRIENEITRIKGYSLKEQQEELKKEAKLRIDHCIDHLEKFGIYEPPKANFLSRVSDTWLSISIPIIVLAIFGLGVIIGKNQMDKDSIKTEQELKELRDSLSIATPALEIPNPVAPKADEKHSRHHSDSGGVKGIK